MIDSYKFDLVRELVNNLIKSIPPRVKLPNCLIPQCIINYDNGTSKEYIFFYYEEFKRLSYKEAVEQGYIRLGDSDYKYEEIFDTMQVFFEIDHQLGSNGKYYELVDDTNNTDFNRLIRYGCNYMPNSFLSFIAKKDEFFQDYLFEGRKIL